MPEKLGQTGHLPTAGTGDVIVVPGRFASRFMPRGVTFARDVDADDGPARGPATGRGRRLPRQMWTQHRTMHDLSHWSPRREERSRSVNPSTRSPLISANAAAKALQDHFLANADRGDNAANDEFVDALLSRIRAQRISSVGGS